MRSGPLAPLPKSAQPSIGVGCFDGECARLNATNPSRVSTRVTPMPQPQNQHLELRDDGTALPFSRRPRYRTRSVPKNGDFTATIKVDSLTSEELMMKPTGKHWSGSNRVWL